jgi:hypothetical protein
MNEILFALAGTYPNIYYAAPLIIVISLVYGATRHENLAEIIEHAVRSLVWVLCFLGTILAVVWLSGFFN